MAQDGAFTANPPAAGTRTPFHRVFTLLPYVNEICQGLSVVVDVLRMSTADWNPVVQTFVFVQVTATPAEAVVAAAAESVLAAPTPSMSTTEVLSAIASGRSREDELFTRCPRVLLRVAPARRQSPALCQNYRP